MQFWARPAKSPEAVVLLCELEAKLTSLVVGLDAVILGSTRLQKHILACIRCTKLDLWERPLLIIKQLEEHELMEFVRIALGRDAMMKLDKIMKDKDISLKTKKRNVEALVFPVVTYGCENWTLRKDERKRIEHWEETPMMKLDKIMKDKDISLKTKKRNVEALVFPVLTYGCEN
ncbi:hypothetical protein LAZ67_17001986 [Cordylochernes scorpioides]|uniref:Reverse transcriptase domain-containing protein n=1 Tax=Cordylochernes scorpioides TaxID=51811 RepID=A0ABY6LE11_9ARAC|nr:hypothetical protein LAZ67_17001986 [Cordylochernes scorpioides]